MISGTTLGHILGTITCIIACIIAIYLYFTILKEKTMNINP
jgi:hypothetical protein